MVAEWTIRLTRTSGEGVLAVGMRTLDDGSTETATVETRLTGDADADGERIARDLDAAYKHNRVDKDAFEALARPRREKAEEVLAGIEKGSPK